MAARESGFGRFDCLTIREVYGNTKRYTATMHKDTEAITAVASHGSGDTPTAAVAAVVESVRQWSANRQASAAKDVEKHGGLLSALASATKEPA